MPRLIALFLVLGLCPSTGLPQTLPAHPPLRVLVVSDEVNPHGLPPEQLTQPGEIAAALLAAPALNRDAGAEAIVEFPTNQIEQATSRLLRSQADPTSYDVLIYFAHRIPNNGADAQLRQDAFVAAVDAFLMAGGGVVSFHHGIYRLPGKEAMQQLLGAEATGGVPWNTLEGQNVINVQPGHFVTAQGVSYSGSVAYSHASFGVAAGNYPLFNNTPDERYPQFTLLAPPAEIEPLFASNYNDNGTTHPLGYVRRRAAWQGVVVVYQPGEYQPNALGPGNNNFQILLNAILFAAKRASTTLLRHGFEALEPAS